MPNRIIKESILTSSNLNDLDLVAELLFYRLLVIADDKGRFIANPTYLLATAFPLRCGSPQNAVFSPQIADGLRQMAAAKIIGLYSVKNRVYGYFLSWSEHQRIRDVRPKYPEPTKDNIIEDLESPPQSGDIPPQISADCRISPPESESESESESEINNNNNDEKKPKRKKQKEVISLLTSEEVQGIFETFNLDFRDNLKNPVGGILPDGTKTETRKNMEEQLNAFVSDLKSRYPEKPLAETCKNVIHGVKETWGYDFIQQIANKSGRALWDAVFRYKVEHGKDRLHERIGWALDYLNKQKRESEYQHVN